jgi:hypothetical protein
VLDEQSSRSAGAYCDDHGPLTFDDISSQNAMVELERHIRKDEQFN